MNRYLPALIVAVFFSGVIKAQHLKPGFDKQEFIEILKVGARTSSDTNYYRRLPAPQQFSMVYQSAEVGFNNLWQLWVRKDSVALISIRGTTKTAVSFLANLYAAMLPAKGSIQLEKNFNFNYNLSDDPKAAVHAGYLVAAAYLSKNILPEIDSCYRAGIKEFIIAGHSQGGAITYLLTSYLESLKAMGSLPKDIRFKTCASAAPKPGNLYYAYRFEDLTRGGWAYNVVNSIDWVPEFPLTVQTTNDVNNLNPLKDAKRLLKKQKFPLNIGLKIAYNQLTKPAKKAQRNYQKWLGKRVSKYVKKNLPGFVAPGYYPSSDFVRTGNTIVLYPGEDYYKAFPQNEKDVWKNHLHRAYLFLTEKLGE